MKQEEDADRNRAEFRQALLHRQDNSCANCGLEFSEDEMPFFRYVIPPSQGGDTSEDNVEPVCKRCLEESGNDTADI